MRFEAEGFGVVEMNVADIGLTDNMQVFFLEARVKKTGDEVLEDLLPDLAFELRRMSDRGLYPRETL